MSKVLRLSTEGLRPEEVQRGKDVLDNLRMRRQIRQEFEQLEAKGYGVYRAAERIAEKYPVSESTARKIKYRGRES